MPRDRRDQNTLPIVTACDAHDDKRHVEGDHERYVTERAFDLEEKDVAISFNQNYKC
jgi:hypothetical protein